MRYRETGEVHVDFHRITNGTIAYLRNNYGREFLDETFHRMASNVYRAIHEDLKQDNPEHLVEHLTYFFDRESGQYTLERKDDESRFVVHRCPAIACLTSHRIPVDPDFCRQTVVVNYPLTVFISLPNDPCIHCFCNRGTPERLSPQGRTAVSRGFTR